MKLAMTFLAGACLAAVSGAGPARADADYDKYMQNAAPVMHYSCASLVEDAGSDEARMLEVVRLMVAVSLYNRNLDVTKMNLSDERKEEIRAKFVDMLKDGCAEDPNGLLAGIVDHSVYGLLKQ